MTLGEILYTDILEPLLNSCVAGQTTLALTPNDDTDTIIGVYIKHDNKSVNLKRNDREHQVFFGDLKGIKKL